MCVVVAVSGRGLRSPRFPSEAGSAEKNSFALSAGETAVGDVRPETGRRGAYLVRELVGVTLVDRLGGEEEGGTVLGSHRSCVMMRERGGVTVSDAAIETGASAATGFGQRNAWVPPSGGRSCGVLRDRTREDSAVSIARVSPRGTHALDRGIHASPDARRARFGGDAPEIRDGTIAIALRAFQSPRIGQAGDAPWPLRATKTPTRRWKQWSGTARIRARTFRRWVKV